MSNPLFSLILPIYNVENYLTECLEVVVNQTNAGVYEVLLVDDGSTDNSGLIASGFANNYKNVHYFKKENGGLSDARNYGLNKSTGDYIVFIDSDDIISPDLLFTLEDVIKRDKADFIYYNYVKFSDGEDIRSNLQHNGIYEGKSVGKKDISSKPNFAWARATKREYYIDNLFPVGCIYEDVLTTPLLTFKCQRPYFVSTPLYGYRKRHGSITTFSASNQFRFFETLAVLKLKSQELIVPEIYYVTAFVNLSQSALVSLVRIKNESDYRDKRNLMISQFAKVSFIDAMKSMSSLKAKFLYSLIRLGKLNTPFLWLLKILTHLNDHRNSFPK